MPYSIIDVPAEVESQPITTESVLTAETVTLLMGPAALASLESAFVLCSCLVRILLIVIGMMLLEAYLQLLLKYIKI